MGTPAQDSERESAQGQTLPPLGSLVARADAVKAWTRILPRLFGGVGTAMYLVLRVVGAAEAQTYADGLAAVERNDDAEALRAFRDAADHGSVPAEYNLGRMYSQGRGAPRDYAQAIDWYRKAADQGNPGAQFNLGLMYENGEGLPRDDAAAADWYIKAAIQGYSSAQVHVGAMYAQGKGVPRDWAQAIAWYRKAAAQFDSDGELNLGLMYLDAARQPPSSGPGMPQEQFFALMNSVFGAGKWRETGGYRSPARENQLRAEGAETVPAGALSRHSLGDAEAPGAFDIVVVGMSPEQAADRLRESGIGFRRLFPETSHGTQGPHLHVEPNVIRASGEASRQGVDPSKDSLRTDGRPASADPAPQAPWAQSPAQNEAAALSWFLRAASQANAGAQFNLGLMYQRGEGVPKDGAIALHWLLRSAEQGDADAQLELGEIYAKGSDAPRDYAEARKWLELAASNDLPEEQRLEAIRLLQVVDHAT
jgi:TPR repeat protein